MVHIESADNGGTVDDFGNIVVIGTTGSGKTTLARAIAEASQRQAVDLDDHAWLPDWQQRPDAEFRARVLAVLQSVSPPQAWVVSGNYSSVEDIVWSRAQTVVALDYVAWRVFWQLLRRTLLRCLFRQPACNGNIETFDKSFLSKDSILLWFFKTHWRRQRKLKALIETPGVYGHLRIIRLTHPDETRQWLTTLT